MYIAYSFGGEAGDAIGADKGTGLSKDLGTLSTGTFTLTGVYLKCWDDHGYNYKSTGGQLCYSNKGGSTEYVSCGTLKPKDNSTEYEWYNSNPGVTLASYTDASGSYSFECWGQTWDWDGGGSSGDWYFPYDKGHYVLNYKIAPPAVSSFNVAATGDIESGDGTDAEHPYIITYNGSLTLTLSGSQAHGDANSAEQYYTVDEWNTTTSRTISDITSSDVVSVTVKMRYLNNSDAELSGAESTKTIYYKANNGGGTGVNNTAVEGKAVKTFENGQLVIIKNGVKYNALGAEVK